MTTFVIIVETKEKVLFSSNECLQRVGSRDKVSSWPINHQTQLNVRRERRSGCASLIERERESERDGERERDRER